MMWLLLAGGVVTVAGIGWCWIMARMAAQADRDMHALFVDLLNEEVPT